MDINVGGVMRSTRKIYPLFQAQGSGVIVNLSSIAGLTWGREGFTYTAAKHAVTSMTKNKLRIMVRKEFVVTQSLQHK